jgi:clan AA aspartic protease
MIHGAVNGRLDLVIPLSLFGSAAQTVIVDAIIDTGFTGFLALPPDTIANLGLAPAGTINARLADGSIIQRQSYSVRVEWEGVHHTIDTIEVDGDPLVGMLLLYDSRLTVDVIAGGGIAIEPLP